MTELCLCRDINGDVHFVACNDLISRTSVYGLLDRGSHEVLMIRDRSAIEFWDLPGGGVELGETRVEALFREVQEETGLILDEVIEEICHFVECFYDISTGAAWKSCRYFYVVHAAGELHPARKNSDDVVDLKFLSTVWGSEKISPVSKSIVEMYYKRRDLR